MFDFPPIEDVAALYDRLPPGTRVELLWILDPTSPLKPGDLGTVQFVGSIGTVFCRWDRGVEKGILWGMGEVRKIGDQK